MKISQLLISQGSKAVPSKGYATTLKVYITIVGLVLLISNCFIKYLPLFVKVPAPTVRKLIVLGLLSPKPLEADFFLEISKTSENKKRPNS